MCEVLFLYQKSDPQVIKTAIYLTTDEMFPSENFRDAEPHPTTFLQDLKAPIGSIKSREPSKRGKRFCSESFMSSI